MEEYFENIKKFNLWDDNYSTTGISRQLYEEKLQHYIGTKLVKVLVGQRRVGKSHLMRNMMLSLISQFNVPAKNIFYINLEYLEYDFIENYRDLESIYQLYKKKLKPKGKVYLFIDEIQNVKDWEKFVNSRSQDFVEEAELFITGSNSNLLSGELSTLLSGRYIEFEIFPYNYSEYLLATAQKMGRKSYIEFLNFGGLPELFNLKNEESQRQYVSSVKDTILLRDITDRRQIRDIKLLDDLFIYLVNNASNLLSVTSLVNYFKSKKRTTSYDTVANYIGYIMETFLIHECQRFNIKGKETIGGNAKYYVNDLAFKNLLFSGFGYGMGFLLENRIYLDLKQAGYKVYTGNIENLEVDFVATKDAKTIYIQSAYLLEEQETLEREYRSLEKINDNFPKWIVSLDEKELALKDGIVHVQGWELESVLRKI